MSSKLKFVSPSDDSPVLKTDWKKCVLCQVHSTEKLSCPADSKKQNVGAGYVSLAEDVNAIQNAGCLLKTLMSRINDGDGVEATLEHHRAKFHSSCRL